MHESQSRFFENIIGRSKSFWIPIFSKLKNAFPEQLKDVTLDSFIKGINKSVPSLIRTEADELSYSLHVIIRYEIEKMIFEGDISVNELPAIWNKKYKEYLGVEPKNDSEGILQDTHWGAGLIGYFPSYALGNVYGAQFLNKMRQDIPTYDEEVKNGNFAVIKDWLRENIHQFGSLYTPSELIVKVTGEELNPKYFLEYLNKKYGEIYDLVSGT